MGRGAPLAPHFAWSDPIFQLEIPARFGYDSGPAFALAPAQNSPQTCPSFEEQPPGWRALHEMPARRRKRDTRPETSRSRY
ncbi:MAG: hypothetical protein QOC79_497 [Actinomycetota bacterium]|nr:hypothetical protein [Actinomycetota bacterium]